MGSINSVSCECGFRSTVRVGGKIATHHQDSAFPFYCKNCGIVSVNIHGNTKECPYYWCKSEIQPYGSEAVSIGKDRFPTIQWGDYMAYHEGNLCPQCKNFTMKFGGAEMHFD
jgi:hypothetical protein